MFVLILKLHFDLEIEKELSCSQPSEVDIRITAPDLHGKKTPTRSASTDLRKHLGAKARVRGGETIHGRWGVEGEGQAPHMTPGTATGDPPFRRELSRARSRLYGYLR